MRSAPLTAETQSCLTTRSAAPWPLLMGTIALDCAGADRFRHGLAPGDFQDRYFEQVQELPVHKIYRVKCFTLTCSEARLAEPMPSQLTSR